MTGPLTVAHGNTEVVVEPGRTLTIGRSADLTIDDNPHLHRRLLSVHEDQGWWWLTNVGSAIAVSVGTEAGHFQAQLGPGATLPLVVPTLRVRFTAGARTYEVILDAPDAVMTPSSPEPAGGDVTRAPLRLSESQRLLVTALAEPALREPGTGLSAMPSSAEAAERLGWPLTTFNRKLDAVCAKLDGAGVEGLRGGPGHLASNRRARLVEFALVSRLVTVADLDALEEGGGEGPGDGPRPLSGDDTLTGRTA